MGAMKEMFFDIVERAAGDAQFDAMVASAESVAFVSECCPELLKEQARQHGAVRR